MSRPRPGAGPALRAPRLEPDDSIAPHITRLGRFRKLDPTKPRELPSVAKVLGVAAWAALLVESLRRARRAAQEPLGEEPASPPPRR